MIAALTATTRMAGTAAALFHAGLILGLLAFVPIAAAAPPSNDDYTCA
jgi:hypothetical protein